MVDPDLPALVTRAKQGDRVAFEKIVHATARVVYAQTVASVRDRQRAEDLTQETFLSAWKSIGTVEKPAGFVSWLLTLARNCTLDAIKFDRRKKRGGPDLRLAGRTRPVADGEERPAERAESPPEAAERAEARERVLRLLEELPEEYRRPLAMRYLAGADYETIRSALGLTDGALRGLLNRGMAVLRERMTRLQK